MQESSGGHPGKNSELWKVGEGNNQSLGCQAATRVRLPSMFRHQVYFSVGQLPWKSQSDAASDFSTSLLKFPHVLNSISTWVYVQLYLP